ncbi:TPA: hypothetical protein ACX6RQ_001170 [Photobacterium damselae]
MRIQPANQALLSSTLILLRCNVAQKSLPTISFAFSQLLSFVVQVFQAQFSPVNHQLLNKKQAHQIPSLNLASSVLKQQ